MMNIEKKKEEILKAWQDYFLSKYPIKPTIEITGFIEESISKILNKLIEFYNGGNLKGIEEALDDLMRYLAADRNLSAGGSMATIFYLKKIFLDKFPKMSKEEFIKLNEAIDLVVCKAFDAYMKAREKLFELRYKEKENRLKMEMKAYEFCMKKCPYIQKAKELGIDAWDLPKEEMDKLMSNDFKPKDE